MAVITIREKQPTENGFAASLIFEGGEYPINITDPFTPQQEQQLEWYFEEWLTYPMLNGKKAEAAKTSVASYGESLFNQVFKADIDAYRLYRGLRGNLKQVKIEIVGNSPEFHALHWEAMRDRDLPRPLGVDCVIIRKRLDKAASVAANMAESPIINLLVVIARPDEEHDVGYRTIARPLIELIQNSQLPVNIDLLRPGTYKSLERHLEAKGAGYYHIIHFDCHGALMGYADIQQGVKRNRYTYQARWGREDIQPYALEIYIEFGDRYNCARTYGQLGLLAKAEENYAEARANLQTALEIYVEYQDEYMATVTRENLEGLPE